MKITYYTVTENTVGGKNNILGDLLNQNISRIMVSPQSLRFGYLGLIVVGVLCASVHAGTSTENEDEYLIQRGLFAKCQIKNIFLKVLFFWTYTVVKMICELNNVLLCFQSIF